MQRSTTNIKSDNTETYKMEEKFIYGMDKLSERFWQCATGNQILRTGINNKIIFFTKNTMSYWKASMHIYTEEKANRNTMWNVSQRLIITTISEH